MKKTYKYGKRGKHIKLGGGKNKTKRKRKTLENGAENIN